MSKYPVSLAISFDDGSVETRPIEDNSIEVFYGKALHLYQYRLPDGYIATLFLPAAEPPKYVDPVAPWALQEVRDLLLQVNGYLNQQGETHIVAGTALPNRALELAMKMRVMFQHGGNKIFNQPQSTTKWDPPILKELRPYLVAVAMAELKGTDDVAAVAIKLFNEYWNRAPAALVQFGVPMWHNASEPERQAFRDIVAEVAKAMLLDKQNNCTHEWTEWARVGKHVERTCTKCQMVQYDD